MKYSVDTDKKEIIYNHIKDNAVDEKLLKILKKSFKDYEFKSIHDEFSEIEELLKLEASKYLDPMANIHKYPSTLAESYRYEIVDIGTDGGENVKITESYTSASNIIDKYKYFIK